MDRTQGRNAEKLKLQNEATVIRKGSMTITSERYKTPKTVPLAFHFEPRSFASPKLRLQDCTIQHEQIEGNDIYIFDEFFIENEAQELRNFTAQAEFSRRIFAEHTSREQGEEPANLKDELLTLVYQLQGV